MDTEKNILNEELNKIDKPQEIEKFIEYVGSMGGYEDIEELAQIKLKSLKEKTLEAQTTPSNLTDQVGKLGGSEENVEETTKETDQKIESLKDETIVKIEEVESQNKNLVNEKAETNNVNIENNVHSETIDSGVEQIEESKKSPEEITREEYSNLNNEIKLMEERRTRVGYSTEENIKFQELKYKKKEIIDNFLISNSEEITKYLPSIELVNKEKTARTVTMNKILGLDLPVDGKDFSMYEINGKNYLSIAGGDPRAENEKANLAKKQVEFFEKLKVVNEDMQKLSKEQKIELDKETELERDALLGESDLDNPIVNLYTKPAQEYKKSLVIVQPNENLYPKSIQGFGQEFDSQKLRNYMSTRSKSAIKIMLMQKRAKEKGLL